MTSDPVAHPNRDVGRHGGERCAVCWRAGVKRFGPYGDYVDPGDWAHPPYPPAFHDPRRWERRCAEHRIVRKKRAAPAASAPAEPAQGALPL